MSTSSKISNDTDFSLALEQLSPLQKRVVGALLVANVESLSTDDRVGSALTKAQDMIASQEELAPLFKSLKRALINHRARCGADSDWGQQASHFVIRAAHALIPANGAELTQEALWTVIQNCRIARSCALISSDDKSENPEAEMQYRILEAFLAAQSQAA